MTLPAFGSTFACYAKQQGDSSNDSNGFVMSHYLPVPVLQPGIPVPTLNHLVNGLGEGIECQC